MTVSLLRGNALALPIADATVDLIVCSPPYFGQRSYQDGGVHYPGQLGSEATPSEFITALVAATREMVRVLKPSGSIWVNLSDKYAGSGRAERNTTGVPTKSLMGIPSRYVIACIDDLGLILRRDQIWNKPTHMPESARDRCATAHEYGFHFVKQPHYFSAVDEIREPLASASPEHDARRRTRTDARLDLVSAGRTSTSHPLGKLPGSVWTIATQPLVVPPELGVEHYAAFPMEWPRRLIAGWSPSGICTGCGEGRWPVTDKSAHGVMLKRNLRHIPGYDHPNGEGQRDVRHVITGYGCACPTPDAPTRPSVILDPFGGTGTTALVAHVMGRHGIHLDMSADYTCKVARWRTTDPDQLAAAAQVEKPPKQVDGQAGLFDVLDAGGAA